MNGKLIGSALVGAGLIAGAAMYYFQVYAFYGPVELGPENAEGSAVIRATPLTGEIPERIAVDGFSGIDSDSSPIRFRACFDTPASFAMLTHSIPVRSFPRRARYRSTPHAGFHASTRRRSARIWRRAGQLRSWVRQT